MQGNVPRAWCRRCLGWYPKSSCSMVYSPVSHVYSGKPCRSPASWSHRRIDECREWQEENLRDLVLD